MEDLRAFPQPRGTRGQNFGDFVEILGPVPTSPGRCGRSGRGFNTSNWSHHRIFTRPSISESVNEEISKLDFGARLC